MGHGAQYRPLSLQTCNWCLRSHYPTPAIRIVRKSDVAGCGYSEVLFVGDSREHDIVGARGVGMTSVLIVEPGVQAPTGESLPTADPHHEIHELAELIALVERRGASAAS